MHSWMNERKNKNLISIQRISLCDFISISLDVIAAVMSLFEISPANNFIEWKKKSESEMHRTV